MGFEKGDAPMLEFLGRAVFAILFTVVAMSLDGMVLWLLWGWFMVPILHLPVLDFMQAIAISLVIGTMTIQYVPKDLDDKKVLKGFLTYLFVNPIVYIVVGWILHFMI